MRWPQAEREQCERGEARTKAHASGSRFIGDAGSEGLRPAGPESGAFMQVGALAQLCRGNAGRLARQGLSRQDRERKGRQDTRKVPGLVHYAEMTDMLPAGNPLERARAPFQSAAGT